LEIVCDAPERNPIEVYFYGNRRWARVNEIIGVFEAYNQR